MHNYRELKIWQNSISLTKLIYEETNNFPDSQKFGLISQLQRASVSVSSNIAEGSSRESQKEFNYFLSLAIGSLFELDTQITIAFEIGYLSKEKYKVLTNLISELIRMSIGFQKSIQSKNLTSKI